jgi:hypothetical protein
LRKPASGASMTPRAPHEEVRGMPPTPRRVLCLFMCLGLCGCRTAPVTGGPAPIYESAPLVLAMPACTATLVRYGTCYAEFKAADGKAFFIGSPGAAPDVESFIATLKEGEAYALPAAFKAFLETNRPPSSASAR